MKKYFFFAACASVAFASCVNDVPDLALESQQKIVFEAPVVSPSSRVAEIANPYPTTGQFSVWAHYYKDGTYTKYNQGTMFMNNVTCNYDGSLLGWSAGDYFFPKNGSLTFSAYSPSSADATISENGISFTDYVVDGDVAKQVDLLFSERAYDKKGYDNVTSVLYAVVALNFKHALSSIRFAVKAYGDYGKTDILVKKIEVLNAYSKADFVQPVEDTNSAQTKDVVRNSDKVTFENFGWSNFENPTTYVAYNNPSPTVVLTHDDLFYPHTGKIGEISYNTTDLILIPQLLKHSVTEHVKVRVTYNLVNPGGVTIEQVSEIDLVNDDDYYDGYESDLNTKIVEDVTAWERGKRYTYVISVALDKIYFEPVVAPWDDIYVAPGI